ncbi:hypothetical protein C8R45DRAFT_944991 [Mycena sanguinolenta]|nr:hypothetical protein C8R45DRAFT_944991 [Mycena sanguinolenta]
MSLDATNFPSIVLKSGFLLKSPLDLEVGSWRTATMTSMPIVERQCVCRVPRCTGISGMLKYNAHKIWAEPFLYGFCHKGTKVDLEAKLNLCWFSMVPQHNGRSECAGEYHVHLSEIFMS